MYLTLPEVENDKNSKRTKDGIFRAQIVGCWIACAPKGYENFRDENKKSILRPGKDASLISEAFERISTGSYSAEEVRKWINKKELKLASRCF